MFESLWVEKWRPKTLDDIVLSDKNRQYFEEVRRKQEIPHLMFAGNPGTGKSTTAKVLVTDVLDCQYLYINASDESGVDTIRTKVTNFARTGSLDGKLKVIVLEEMDALTSVKSGGTGSSAQQALRNVIEEYADNTRFIATCNYRSMIIPALDSRFQTFDLTPPYDKCIERVVSILKAENVKVSDDQKPKLLELVKVNYPDLRKMIGDISKNIIDGKLVIEDQTQRLDFAEEVFTKLVKKQIADLRQFVIQNEIRFSNNYHTLLRNLFDVVYNSKLDFEKKRTAMLIIANAMGQHGNVMDVEINAYACLLELSDVI
jgi:DNA polymerase III delta prime subunit